MDISAAFLSEKISSHIRGNYGKPVDRCTLNEFWDGLAKTILEITSGSWEKTGETYSKGRTVAYLSAEFLVGRAMLNNLINLGIYEEAKEAMASFGVNLSDVLETETDASLGNGGLGRLAACFIDSCATLNYPVRGYGILYRYGLFKQAIEDGFQVESPDRWMENGYAFTVPRYEDKVLVHYNDFDVWAIPYDMPIIGYGTNNINRLRLWKAEPLSDFDFSQFNDQNFDGSVGLRNRANDIWRVLYPNDTSNDGKLLRVRQQYFFVSASVQDLVRIYKKEHGDDLSDFAKYNMMQLNDTHPVIAIPELMRVFIDENGMDWQKAWGIVRESFGYTNHTILSEALEKWSVDIFRYLFPRIFQIIEGIDNQFRREMQVEGLSFEQIEKMAPLSEGRVHMAWLAIYASRSVNGVAALHTEILKRDTLKSWYEIYPSRFSNKTNGVAPRRWIRSCNPGLAALLTELSGSDAWITDLDALASLEGFAEDDAVMHRFLSVKKEKKQALSDFCRKTIGISIDPESVFDMQIKRLHEYKRQLLNILYVLNLYDRMKENPEMDFPPITFFFGAKAAPGYFRAKAIIKFINEAANLINNDPEIKGRLKVVFVPNYNVSNGERMFPAADISEQISTAGLEASGTGNMKFMMNGALTLGTLDGANVEIAEVLEKEDIYIFGCLSENMADTMAFYNPKWQYENVPGLKKAVDRLIDGSLHDGGTGFFNDIYNGLLQTGGWQKADYYYVLGDFEDYREKRDQAYLDYKNRLEWARKCWKNICRSGRFSSDRTITDYAENIWKIEKKKI